MTEQRLAEQSNTMVMMKCGCASQTVRVMKDGSRVPSCFTHDCLEVAESPPSLADRKARCAYYGKTTSPRGSYGGGNECNYGQRNAQRCTCEQPSSPELPFFEYLGPGSPYALTMCKCGYYEVAHGPAARFPAKCKRFEPVGAQPFDKFFCGCQGWD